MFGKVKKLREKIEALEYTLGAIKSANDDIIAVQSRELAKWKAHAKFLKAITLRGWK